MGKPQDLGHLAYIVQYDASNNIIFPANITASSIIKTGGTAAQILAADGSVITAGTNITISGGTISASGGGGSISLAAIGSTPNANAATLTGTVLNLEPASASFGGVVTTAAQTFSGTKTFTNGLALQTGTSYITYNYNAAQAASRTWRLSGDQIVFGDFAIQQSTTQTGSTFDTKLYLDATANVGIGTITIGSKLQINGNAAIGYSASTAAPTNGLAVSGSVGIGITSPSKPLTLAGAMNSFSGTQILIQPTLDSAGVQLNATGGGGRIYEFQSTTAGNFIFYDRTASAFRFTINSSGDFGFNTQTIGSKLQVNGNAAIGYSASTAAPTNGLSVAGNLAVGLTTTTTAQVDILSSSTVLQATGSGLAATTFVLKNTNASFSNSLFYGFVTATGSTAYRLLDLRNNNGSTEVFKVFGNGATEIASSVTANSFVKSGGLSTQYLMADGSVTTGGGGSTSPAGSNTQIQYNNSGAFGASSKFTWDNTNECLSIISEAGGGTRGLNIFQNNTGVQAAAAQFNKSRGTNASPTAVASGDLIGAFVFKPYISAAYVQDQSLFGASMTSTTGISQWFIAGTTANNYTPNLLIAENGNVTVGNLGSGTIITSLTLPTSKLQVVGNAAIGYTTATAAPTNGLAVAGAATIGTSSNTTASAFLVNSSGTAANAWTSALYVQNANATSGALNGIAFVNSGGFGSAAIYTTQFQTGNAGDNLVFTTKNSGGGWNTGGIVINTSGNLGVNTTTIGSSLQVNGNAAIGYSASTAAPTNGLAVSGNSGFGTTSPGYTATSRQVVAINGGSGGAQGSILAFMQAGVNKGYVFSILNDMEFWCESGAITIGNNAAANITFKTNNTERLRIESGGNLGLGTTTIGSKLQVNGNAAIGYSASTAAPTNGLQVAGAAIFASTIEANSLSGASSLIQQWSYNGGAAAYNLKLNTVVTSGNVRYSFDLRNNSTDYLNNLVLEKGWVGIGTNSVQNALDVVRGTAGTMGRGTYETAAFSYNADMKVGVYTSSGTASDGASLLFGQTNLQAASTYPGFELQYQYSSTVANNHMRINYVGRNASGLNTTATANLLVVSQGGRVGVNLAQASIGSTLQVNGNAAIGYSASTAAPTNGLAVAGDTTIGGILTTNNGTNSTNGIKVVSSLSTSLFTGGIEFIRTTVVAGSKIEPIRDATNGGVGFNFLTTTSNANEVSGTYNTALTILNSGAATFSSSVTAATDLISSNGTLYVSAGSGLSYSSRLSTAYNFPYVDTYLDSFGGASYEGRLNFRTNSGGGAMSTKLTITNSGAATFSMSGDSYLSIDKAYRPATPQYFGGLKLTGGGYEWGRIETIQTNPSASWTSRMAFFTMRGAGGAVVESMAITNDGNVGIGTDSPEALLHINKAASGGEGAFIFLDNSAGSTLGNKSGIRFATDTGATFSNYNAYIEAVNVDAGNGAASITFGTWNGSSRGERMSITSGGNLIVSGDVTAFSDKRLKENIVQIDSALDKINAINGYYYNRIDTEDKSKKIGFIAQEIQSVVPELVNYDSVQDKYSVLYGNTSALLLEGIKEHDVIIKAQAEEIKELKRIINGLTK